jgi:hypothetical protein
VLIQRPQPKHRSGLKAREPPRTSLAPNWHRSTHSPQSVHDDVSVAAIAGDVGRRGYRPNLRTPENLPQQCEQQLQTELMTPGVTCARSPYIFICLKTLASPSSSRHNDGASDFPEVSASDLRGAFLSPVDCNTT